MIGVRMEGKRPRGRKRMMMLDNIKDGRTCLWQNTKKKKNTSYISSANYP